MTKRNAFSDGEWRTLLFGPLVVFYVVAYADGSISRLESGRLSAMIDNGTKLTQPNTELTREVFTSLQSQLSEVLRSFESAMAQGETFEAMLAAACTVLDAKAPHAEALLFKQVLVTVGTATAEAGPLLGAKVSESERASVARVQSMLGLT